MNTRAWQFIALAFMAFVLGGALAHLYELQQKLRLSREEYLVVQQVYRGWALLGIPIAGAIIATGALVVTTERHRPAFRWSLMALLCLLAAQAIFWTFTYPTNVATANWTELPDQWTELRRRWEYSHAAGAALSVAAYLALVAAVLATARAGPEELNGDERRGGRRGASAQEVSLGESRDPWSVRREGDSMPRGPARP